MPNAFGGFLHISPLSNLSSSTSHPPCPSSSLASNCIRDYFGPIVQTVADCLLSKGPLTLSELISYITSTCARDWNTERERLVNRLNANLDNSYYHGSKVHMNKARGSETAGFVTDATHIRAALLVLLQHSLIHISGGKSRDGVLVEGEKADPTSSSAHYTYTFLADRAKLLMRYPKYVERVKDVIDDNAGCIVETLLCEGRMRAEDVISAVWSLTKQGADDDDKDGEDIANSSLGTEKILNDDEPSMEEIEAFFSEKPDKVSSNNAGESPKQQALREIVASFKMLTEAGYIEAVKPIVTAQEMIDLQDKEKELDNGIQGGEFELDVGADGNIPDKKKGRRKRSTTSDRGKQSKKAKTSDSNELNDYGGSQCKNDDPTIVELLEPLRKLIPAGSVYRVNTNMCHASLRSMVLGRLVQEFYGPRPNINPKNKSTEDDALEHVGKFVTAAVTFAARQEHAPIEQILGLDESEEDKHRRMAEWGAFTPSDIAPYLPPEVTNACQSMVGGTLQNISAMLIKMSQLRYPPIVIEVEDASGHPNGGKFEICTRQLTQRLRDRILHRVITTRHGLVAARIVSILQVKGHMESDQIAEDAMVPAKEAREILHRLHRDKYVNLFDMHMTKTHNSGTAIYLWHVIDDQLLQAVVNDVNLAILNLRLRRQHEVEVGKDWMDRAKEAGATEENAHEQDQKRYQKFCKGLERLDCTLLQLDETLMVLKDI